MIDLHHHLIYGVDDGPADLATSLSLAEMALAEGITQIVCTPHANASYTYPLPLIQNRLQELRDLLAERLELHLGCDFHLSSENVSDALLSFPRYSIAERGYLLVEFPDLLIPPDMETALYQLQSAGYTLIITHPERCPAIQQQPGRLATWIRRGALVQITAGSLTGRFGPQAEAFSKAILKRHWVHFVATDAHHPEWRPPRMQRAMGIVRNSQGEAGMERIFQRNPLAALTGERLEEQPTPLDLEEDKELDFQQGELYVVRRRNSYGALHTPLWSRIFGRGV